MAHLINLNDRRPRAPAPPARLSSMDETASATVLFFTGVRYERADETSDRLDLSERRGGKPGKPARGKGKKRA